MFKVRNWSKKNKVVGKPPLGCQLCSLGAKLVVFITGTCPFNCFYCPVSKERKTKGTFADEQEINSVEEAIEEAKQIDALGASITGGEPTLELDKTIEYIQGLKREFGKEFHIHLYTARAVSNNELTLLFNTGLDEIRFHFPELKLNTKIKKAIIEAKKFDWDVGIEIPAIPGKENEVERIVEFAIKNKLSFVNLNEFEFSETNYSQLTSLNFEPLSSAQSAVKGSRKTALKILKKYKRAKITLHYCSSVYKDRIQLRNRFLRRAKNYAKKFDFITEDGLIVRGRIIVKEKDTVKNILSFLTDAFLITEDMLEVDIENKTIYLSAMSINEIGGEIVKRFSDKITQIAIIHQYPMDNGFITFLDPLFEEEKD